MCKPTITTTWKRHATIEYDAGRQAGLADVRMISVSSLVESQFSLETFYLRVVDTFFLFLLPSYASFFLFLAFIVEILLLLLSTNWFISFHFFNTCTFLNVADGECLMNVVIEVVANASRDVCCTYIHRVIYI